VLVVGTGPLAQCLIDAVKLDRAGRYAYVGSFVAFELVVVTAAWLRYRALHRKVSAEVPAEAVPTVP